MTSADVPSNAAKLSPFAAIGPAVAASGFSPIPIRPNGKSPGEYSTAGEWANKSKWQRWCREAPGPIYIARWASWPSANIGVCCGRGVIALDIDIDELVQPILAVLPPILVAKRGRKGLTVFFRADTNMIRSRGFRVRRGSENLGLMDLISDGKQTVLPPSIHPDTGFPYVWTTERTLADTRPEELPECTDAHFEAVLGILRAHGWEDDEHDCADGAAAWHIETGETGNVFRDVNDEALANLDLWVPKLGLRRLRRYGQGFRSVAEWRPSYSNKPLNKREYHVSFNPKGIVDYGDGEKGMTAIDVVMSAKGLTLNAATDWLNGALGHMPKPPIVLNRKPKPPGHVKPQRPGTEAAEMTAPTPAEPAGGIDQSPPQKGPAWPMAVGVAPRSVDELAWKDGEALLSRTPYPIEMLGDILGTAASAIADKIQCAPAIAAQSVLAVGSLAAQGIADVQLPYGQARPLSLFALTVAQSGDRKSTADNEAMRPVRMREKQLREAHDVAAKKYAAKLAAWRAEHDAIKRKKASSPGLRQAEFEALGLEPMAPVLPILTVPDATHEGLAACMPQMPFSVGLFSDEGARLLGGHGFTPENKAATAANFSKLWDEGGIRRLRKTTGITDLHGRRLSAHLMIQPSVAVKVVADPDLRGQGLLARFLVAAPESLAGSRLWREPSQQAEEALLRYVGRILFILERVDTADSELSLRTLKMDAEAKTAWIELHDQVERDQRQGRGLFAFRDVGAKAAEQAARIAGVLTIVEDCNAVEIGGDAMLRACLLARWHVAEAVRVFTHAEDEAEETEADVLRDWLAKKGFDEVTEREIARGAPARIRKSIARKAAIETLEIAGHLIPLGKKAWKVQP